MPPEQAQPQYPLCAFQKVPGSSALGALSLASLGELTAGGKEYQAGGDHCFSREAGLWVLPMCARACVSEYMMCECAMCMSVQESVCDV